MPVRSLHNQYRGINAHLHSRFQTEGGWSEFHTRHIVHLADTLRAHLLPMEYTAHLEPSLQIRRIDQAEAVYFPESDVTLYDLDPYRAAQPPIPQAAASGEVVLSIPQALLAEPLSEKDYAAISIYDRRGKSGPHGDPVAWLELLSPSNKPNGQDSEAYTRKRLAVIESGLVFIELDYLHESPPTLYNLPAYRPRPNAPANPQAHPYRILIIDPRPDWRKGIVRVNEFDVDDPLPTVRIPLSADEGLVFDFGIPYQKTFREALYGLEWIDYSQLPPQFDRYSQADQERILRRLAAVLEAAEQGADLEQAPLPLLQDPRLLEKWVSRLREEH